MKKEKAILAYSFLFLVGLAFYKHITTNEQLVTALKQGDYKLIINGKIEE